MNRQCDNLGH